MSDVKLKVFYISDLHLDFRVGVKYSNLSKKLKVFREDFINNSLLNLNDLSKSEDEITLETFKESLLVIAGDISNWNYLTLEFLKTIKDDFGKICIVGGNHELYLISKTDDVKYNYNSLNRELDLYQGIKGFDTENKIHFLGEDYDGILNYKGKVIVGERMVSNPYSNEGFRNFYESFMNDYKNIKIKDNNNVKVSVNYLYNKNKEYYKALLNLNKVDLFVSHYPIIITDSHIMNGRAKDGSIGSYYCDLDDLGFISKNNIFGHTHEISKYVISDEDRNGNNVKYNFYSNAIGYPGEFEYALLKMIEI